MNLLLHKYRVLGKKGEGTFSEVLKCQSIKDGSFRACKKMKQTYESIEQVNNLREIQAMRRLSPHPNILELQEVLFDKKSGTLILVCELMDMNIYELIRGKRHYLPETKARHYMFQLLKAVDHMHRNGIFHRDVKPENILIKDDLLKLADFGSCRSLSSKQPYTEYISTRWYRAPECLLTDGHYNYKMDMWSVGCVFFEILSLHPLFPGSNEVDQIAKIHDRLGSPAPSILSKFRRSRGMSFNFPHKRASGIESLLTHVSSEAIQLIYLLCTYDPEERITAHQALKHVYFNNWRFENKKEVHLSRQQKPETRVMAPEDDNHISESIIHIDEDPSSPLKARMTEITMYPTIPKAQSHPSHPFVSRRVHQHKRLTELHFLPRAPMHTSSFNPTFQTTSFSTSFNKQPTVVAAAAISRTLLPTIYNSHRIHKPPARTTKVLYNQYTLPSLDKQHF
ncbi:hypothetical protein BsWGS_09817 [Bradybaena similaris]